jgi:hypothetical protein
VLLLPWYILSGILVLLLVIREFQHQKTVKGLLDRILESRGLTALPDGPVADLLNKIGEVKEEAKLPEKKILMERTVFKIPNMGQFKGK